MAVTIDFEYQADLLAGEVDDVWADGRLPAEVPAFGAV
jgi:hypothetical protein